MSKGSKSIGNLNNYIQVPVGLEDILCRLKAEFQLCTSGYEDSIIIYEVVEHIGLYLNRFSMI